MTKSERKRAAALAKAAKPTESPAPAPAESPGAVLNDAAAEAIGEALDAGEAADVAWLSAPLTADEESALAALETDPGIPWDVADGTATAAASELDGGASIADFAERHEIELDSPPLSTKEYWQHVGFTTRPSLTVEAPPVTRDPDRPRLCRVVECAVQSGGKRHEVGTEAVFSAADIASLPSLLIPVD